MRSIVWFRTDLRLEDNPALKKAFTESDEIHAVFIYSKEQLKIHNESNIKIDFLIRNLNNLEQSLASLNIPLILLDSLGFDDNGDLLNQYAIDNSINAVYWNNQFGEDEEIRDKKVLKILQKSNIKVKNFHDQVVYEPGTLKTGQNQPYSVFTPFKRKWIEKFSGSKQSNIKNFDFDFEKTHFVEMDLWLPGEDEAKRRLEDFLKNKINSYSKNRNDPILDGTSRISPYLALGIISPKKCILEALKLNNFEFSAGSIGITKWIDEIVWREFYKNIMLSFPKVSRGQPFQDYSKNIEWRYNEEEFEAWKVGKTGFPIIDAAMRQLSNEGWMHNRLRMVVAMFFTKNMLHDWRLGEAFFMQNLIDGDFASNNGGWQWSSSTGTDAAPYFRIFNPITQSINFDKEGIVIILNKF